MTFEDMKKIVVDTLNCEESFLSALERQPECVTF